MKRTLLILIMISVILGSVNFIIYKNNQNDKEEVVEVVVHQGKATFEFSTKNYDSSNNIIEGFSVFDPNRPKTVIYTYNVPESEIPK